MLKLTDGEIEFIQFLLCGHHKNESHVCAGTEIATFIVHHQAFVLFLREVNGFDETGKHVAKVRADHQEAQRDALESQLLEEKVMALLTERAKINEGERPEPEAQTEGSDGPAPDEAEEGEDS